MTVFIVLMSFVILWRIAELVYARHNEKWLLQQGAVEYGKEHYPYMIALHSSFFVAIIVEYALRQPQSYSIVLMLAYLVLLLLKVWVLASLGKFWNTKIYRIPHLSLVQKGAYKWIKHPNYVIVVLEIALIPLIFQLYITAIVFSLLNAAMLYVRISAEDKALLQGK